MNHNSSEEALNKIVTFFNGANAYVPQSAISTEDILDMLEGHEFISAYEVSIDTDTDEMLQDMSDDCDEEDMPDGAIMLFVKSDRFQLDKDDMLRIGEIAEEISEDIDIVWGICSQRLPRGENMHVRIAKFYREQPDLADED